MAIPERPLQLTFDTEDLTLGEFKILEGHYTVGEFRDFLLKYGSWTPAEVLGLKKREIADVSLTFAAALREALVPKASATP